MSNKTNSYTPVEITRMLCDSLEFAIKGMVGLRNALPPVLGAEAVSKMNADELIEAGEALLDPITDGMEENKIKDPEVS